MSPLSVIITILGLALFEVISSIDNAIINAEVLSTMGQKIRRWFLLWGLIIAVFVIRGVLPWLIVWLATPTLGPMGALTATFSNDPQVVKAIHASSPILLTGGGTFLILLFFYWLFLEPKVFGLKGERFFFSQGLWFYALASLILTGLVWLSLKENPTLALGATIGSTAFFITHGFKQNATLTEESLLKRRRSDLSKLLYLEVIDATFSIDGVLGAFAFTLSVPLIILGNGLGAVVVRQLTMSSIHRIKKYVFLKNGAMYSIFFLGIIMIAEGFSLPIPSWFSPLITFAVVGYFFYKSKDNLNFVSS